MTPSYLSHSVITLPPRQNPILTRCAEADAATLSDLALRVFVRTFEPHNTPENMADYVSKTYSPAHQLREIKDPARIVVMARLAGKAVGYYQLFSHEPEPCVRGSRPIELLRLYVDHDYHGHGVARQLMEHAISEAAAGGFDTLWLGVWERNFRAQAFYQKMGFQKVGSHIFVMGTEEQTDWIMQKSLGGF